MNPVLDCVRTGLPLTHEQRFSARMSKLILPGEQNVAINQVISCSSVIYLKLLDSMLCCCTIEFVMTARSSTLQNASRQPTAIAMDKSSPKLRCTQR